MALIKCPECGREGVSDSAESCPSCGYGIKAYHEKITEEENLFEEQRKSETNQVQEKINVTIKQEDIISSDLINYDNPEINIMKKNKKRKILIIGIVFIILAIIITIITITVIKEKEKKEASIILENNTENQFIDDIKYDINNMQQRSNDCEYIIDIVSTVWHSSIFDKGSRNDFNTNIKYLYSGDEYLDTKTYNKGYDICWYAKITGAQVQTLRNNVAAIKKSNLKLIDSMKVLQNYPDKYKDIYNETLALYQTYQEICSQANSPAGTYLNFCNTTKDSLSEFSSQYKKISAMIP